MVTPPNRFVRMLAVMLVSAMAAVLPGCSCENNRASGANATTGTQVTGQSQFSPEQFNLGLIVSELTSGNLSVKDLDGLQTYINDNSEDGPPINGLDVDGDHIMDWVQVTSDVPSNGTVTIDFTGCKSKTSQETCDAFYVASIKVRQDASGQYIVTGDYSSTVPGYDAYHYERRAAFRDALFYSSLYHMTRPRVIVPMGVVHYRPAPVMSPSMMRQRQSSYVRTKKITTVTKRTMPNAVKKSQSARTASKTMRTPGRVAGPGRTLQPQKPRTLKDATKGQKNFMNNGQSQSTKRGNSFRGNRAPKAPAGKPGVPFRTQAAPPRRAAPPPRRAAPPRRRTSAPRRRSGPRKRR